MFKWTRSNSKKDIWGSNQLDFRVSFVNCKKVIIQTTNIAKIYFSFTSSTEELISRLKTLISLVWFSRQIAKMWSRVHRKGPDRKQKSLFILPNYRWLVNWTPATHPPSTPVEDLSPLYAWAPLWETRKKAGPKFSGGGGGGGGGDVCRVIIPPTLSWKLFGNAIYVSDVCGCKTTLFVLEWRPFLQDT